MISKQVKISTVTISIFIFISVLILALSFFVGRNICLKKANSQLSADVNSLHKRTLELTNSLKNIQKDVSNIQSNESNVIEIKVYELQEDKSIESIVDTMQYQYDNFTGNWSIYIALIGVAFTLIAIIFPILNYVITQKETVDKLEKKLLESKEQLAQNSKMLLEVKDSIKEELGLEILDFQINQKRTIPSNDVYYNKKLIKSIKGRILAEHKLYKFYNRILSCYNDPNKALKSIQFCYENERNNEEYFYEYLSMLIMNKNSNKALKLVNDIDILTNYDYRKYQIKMHANYRISNYEEAIKDFGQFITLIDDSYNDYIDIPLLLNCICYIKSNGKINDDLKKEYFCILKSLESLQNLNEYGKSQLCYGLSIYYYLDGNIEDASKKYKEAKESGNDCEIEKSEVLEEMITEMQQVENNNP